jgi:hypothetical protein
MNISRRIQLAKGAPYQQSRGESLLIQVYNPLLPLSKISPAKSNKAIKRTFPFSKSSPKHVNFS